MVIILPMILRGIRPGTFWTMVRGVRRSWKNWRRPWNHHHQEWWPRWWPWLEKRATWQFLGQNRKWTQNPAIRKLEHTFDHSLPILNFAVQSKRNRRLCLCVPENLKGHWQVSLLPYTDFEFRSRDCKKYNIWKECQPYARSTTRCCFPVAVSPRSVAYGTTASHGTKGGTLKFTKRRRSVQEQKGRQLILLWNQPGQPQYVWTTRAADQEKRLHSTSGASG